MLESLLQGQVSANNPGLPIPPLSEFKNYYDQSEEGKFVGYYGMLGNAAYITTDRLISECKLTGIATNEVRFPNFLKFYIDGKIIAFPQQPIASGMTWEDLNNRGLVYGEKIIDMAGGKWKVRLFKTLPGDADSFSLKESDTLVNNTPFFTVGSEYNRTILNCCTDSQQPGERKPGEAPWENFKAVSYLGISSNSKSLSYVWMQEEFKHTDGRKGRIQRPSLNVTDRLSHFWFFDTGGIQGKSCLWRPVLELIND